MNEKIFKAYDVRGIYPSEINEDAVYKIAQAFAKFLGPKKVVVGRDVRLSGPSLWSAVAKGLTDHGVDVIDIGVGTTDMMYFAAATYECDGGIIVSASHNPKEFNGLKLVRKGAVPISGDTGIMDMKKLAMEGYALVSEKKGTITTLAIQADYLKKCLSFIDLSKLKPLTVVANGMFGPAVQNVIAAKLPITLVAINEVPDGNFPKGQPDPLQEKNRAETVALIEKEKPDLGAAWDADADRFFLFDENGRFVPGYYLTAFLGEYFVKKNGGKGKVIHDTRLVWATQDVVRAAGGEAVENKAGHSFIKERMRKEDALFAGEMSGHFYFREYFYADNGLIPFLLMLQIISESGKKVSELFDPYFEKYFISGEINMPLRSFDDLPPIFERVRSGYKDGKFEEIDGLGVSFTDWRANVRGSNTEPVVRLNVEAKTEALCAEKRAEFERLIKS